MAIEEIRPAAGADEEGVGGEYPAGQEDGDEILNVPRGVQELEGEIPKGEPSPSLTRMPMAPEGASSCMTSFAIVLHLRSRAPETWSAWVWVSIMYAGLSPCLKRRSIIGSTISSSGSLSPRASYRGRRRRSPGIPAAPEPARRSSPAARLALLFTTDLLQLLRVTRSGRARAAS